MFVITGTIKSAIDPQMTSDKRSNVTLLGDRVTRWVAFHKDANTAAVALKLRQYVSPPYTSFPTCGEPGDRLF